VAPLRDARPRPQIPTATVWLCAFALFALRRPSFHAIEQELRRPKRWESWVGARKPSADTLGRVLAGLSLAELRALGVAINRGAWRRKALPGRPGERDRVVAVDGHELGASRARCCAKCLRRQVRVGGVPQVEYYHRVMVAQWVGVTPPAIVDLELVGPDEGEVVAARRLVERILHTYARLIDVITADALYLEAPFIQRVLDAGKHVVVVLKQEARELYQDAEGLRALVPPAVLEEPERTTRLWDLPELTTFTTVGRPMRVVWAEEDTRRVRCVGGQRQVVPEERRWIWVTDLSAGETFDVFQRLTAIACQEGASGFMVGRAIWQEAMALPDAADRDRFLATTASSRLKILTAIADVHAVPWTGRFGDPATGPAAREGWHVAYAE